MLGGDFDLSFNFVSTPQINGATEYALATGPGAIFGTPYSIDPTGGFGPGSGAGLVTHSQWVYAALRNHVIGKDNRHVQFEVDRAFGIPVTSPFFSNPFAAGPIDIAVTDVYPRVNIVGGSIEHTFDHIGTTRLEVTYTPAKEFRWLWTPSPVKDGELSIAGMFRRDFNWPVESIPATTLQLEYWYKSRSDFFDRYASNYEERDLPLSFFMLEQPLLDRKLIFDNTVVLDVSQGGGAWFQPGFRFHPSEHWLYEAFYNFFWGGQRDMFGEFSSLDEIFMRVTYSF